MEQPTEKELMESYLAQRKQLDQWIRHHPMFAHEIRRIKNQIDHCGNYRQTHTQENRIH